ncbi:MAG: hypothetical protein ACJAZO_001538 [Myxococcota bacterium]|jgi:hypothetical protein
MPRFEKAGSTTVILSGLPADLDQSRIQLAPDTPGVTIESFAYEVGTSDDWTDL